MKAMLWSGLGLLAAIVVALLLLAATRYSIDRTATRVSVAAAANQDEIDAAGTQAKRQVEAARPAPIPWESDMRTEAQLLRALDAQDEREYRRKHRIK